PALAEACGVAIVTAPPRRLREEERPQPGLAWFGDILENASSPVTHSISRTDSAIPWSDLVEMAAKAARGHSAACIGRCGSPGRVRELAARCRHRREVEHVVMYNPDGADDARIAEVLEEGVRVLSRIPGVRRVFVGRSITPGGRYAHAWVVRFASEGVVALYRDHPDHVAFADRHFRPLAPDRMTLDFMDEE
ncbi:MAG TPA: Dabb family protein, partial [Candidatus Omnitrophota bacterium]|nr:Dabb family protein [Candidatus Omnitrophota bacterium]